MVIADRMWCTECAAFYGDYTCFAMLAPSQLWTALNVEYRPPSTDLLGHMQRKCVIALG
jgi:hypothetical protein